MPPDQFFLAGAIDSATDPARINRAWVLFLVLAILLTLFILGIALMTISHRLRNRREESIEADEEDLDDPWREAGKRAAPFDSSDSNTPQEPGDDEQA